MTRWFLPLLVAAALGVAGCQTIPVGWPEPSLHNSGVAVTTAANAPVSPPIDQAAEPIAPPRLGAPVLPPPDGEREINLTEALAIAGVDNPTIALAEEAVRASEAHRLEARALLLPTLDAGAHVRVHQGTLLSGTGFVRQVNLQSFYIGDGAFAVGAGTVVDPGIRIYAHLGDAWLAPQAAEQYVAGRRFDAVAVRHRTLLEVGSRYLALAAAHAHLQALRRSQEDLSEMARLTANLAAKGQGRDADAQRALSESLLLEGIARQAQEDLAVAAAELARLLDLDPTVQLRPADAAVPLLELFDPAAPLPELLQTAFLRHPELAARSADVAFAQVRVQQEHARPWLPLVSVGVSAGEFGGAGNLAANRSWTSAPRVDIDVLAVWSLQNFGLGNRAVESRALAEAGQAEAQRARAVDRIRTEVAEAHALIQARKRETDVAHARLDSAGKAFAADMIRAKNLEARPIEILRSLDLLTTARLDLVRITADYSDAQLRLAVATGTSMR